MNLTYEMSRVIYYQAVTRMNASDLEFAAGVLEAAGMVAMAEDCKKRLERVNGIIGWLPEVDE